MHCAFCFIQLALARANLFFVQGEMRELAKLVGFDGSDDEWTEAKLATRPCEKLRV